MKIDVNPKLIPVKALFDNQERTWWLGTDCLEDSDLKLLTGSSAASYQHVEGYASIMHVPQDDSDYAAEYWKGLEKVGFSARFVSILQEAKRRGYAWVVFECEIETAMADVDEEADNASYEQALKTLVAAGRQSLAQLLDICPGDPNVQAYNQAVQAVAARVENPAPAIKNLLNDARDMLTRFRENGAPEVNERDVDELIEALRRAVEP